MQEKGVGLPPHHLFALTKSRAFGFARAAARIRTARAAPPRLWARVVTHAPRRTRALLPRRVHPRRAHAVRACQDEMRTCDPLSRQPSRLAGLRLCAYRRAATARGLGSPRTLTRPLDVKHLIETGAAACDARRSGRGELRRALCPAARRAREVEVGAFHTRGARTAD